VLSGRLRLKSGLRSGGTLTLAQRGAKCTDHHHASP
jgi:hypothetical protein